jgi:hypothetical protein
VQVLVELSLIVHRDPVLPTVTLGELQLPHQRAGTSAPSLREEVIYTTTKILQGLTFLAYSSLRKTAGTPGEKTQNYNHKDKRD